MHVRRRRASRARSSDVTCATCASTAPTSRPRTSSTSPFDDWRSADLRLPVRRTGFFVTPAAASEALASILADLTDPVPRRRLRRRDPWPASTSSRCPSASSRAPSAPSPREASVLVDALFPHRLETLDGGSGRAPAADGPVAVVRCHRAPRPGHRAVTTRPRSSSSAPASRAPASPSTSRSAASQRPRPRARGGRGRRDRSVVRASSGCTTTSPRTPGSPGRRSRTSRTGPGWSATATAASSGPASSRSCPTTSPPTCGPTWRRSRRSASTPGMLDAADVARLVPGVVTDDVTTAIYEPSLRICRPIRDRGRVPRRGARARRPGRPGLLRDVGRASTATGSPASRPTAVGSRPRSSSMSPGHGRPASPGRSASRSRSRPGATTRPTSACPTAARPTSRSSSTRSTRSTSGPRAARRCWSASRAATRSAARPTGRCRDAAPGHGRGDGPPRLRPRAVDGGRHAADEPRRAGRHHARPARHPRAGRAGWLLPRLRLLRDRLQDRAGHRALPDRTHPRRTGDDGRHRGLLGRAVRGRPAARRRASRTGMLWH